MSESSGKLFFERYERAIVIMLLGAAAALRLYKTPCWILANCDEISALNQIGLPFLSGACTSTNYLMTTLLLKSIGKILTFPNIRWLTAFVNVVALYTGYRVIRQVSNGIIALTALTMLTFSWNVIYFSRLFECGSFTPSISIFFMCCMLKWVKDPTRSGWLFLAALIIGFHLNTHAMPSFYAILIFIAWMAIQVPARALSLKDAFIALSILVWSALPYIYTLSAFCRFRDDLSVSYGALSLSPALTFAINMRNPLFFIKTLSNYFTFFPIYDTSHIRFGFTFLAVLIPLIANLAAPKSNLKSYLAFVSFGTLLLIGISPIPVYNEGHLHIFWAHFVTLLALLIAESRMMARIFLTGIFLIIITLNISWIPHIFRNQVAEVDRTLKLHLRDGEPVYISDGAMLKLRMLPLYSQIEQHPLFLFYGYGKDAMKPLKRLALDGPALLIATSDIPWPGSHTQENTESRLLLSNEQFMEANYKQGLRIYELSPLK